MGGGGSKPTFTPPYPAPVFLDIEVDTNEDTKYMPSFNFSRGTIVPAEFDGYGNIINHPTAFYIFCTTKIYNYYKTNALPINSTDNQTDTYQQFALTQGNDSVFPPTVTNNTIPKNLFSLTTFSNALTTNINSTDSSSPINSPGLLVPVYCYKDTATSFRFFRADAFYSGSGDPIQQLPDKPLQYISPRGLPSFPDVYGKNKSSFYNLCSFYKNNKNDKQQIGSWCIFLTDSQFSSLNQNWNSAPVPGYVSISFNYPQASDLTYQPVKSLNTSQLYTVYKINQTASDSAITNWKPTEPAFTDVTPNQWKVYNMGYPLNFIYQVGANNSNYKNMTATTTYYQQDYSSGNYVGTVCQNDIPSNEDKYQCTGNWNLSNVSMLFNGDTRNTLSEPVYFNLTNIVNNNTNKIYNIYNCNCWDDKNAYCQGEQVAPTAPGNTEKVSSIERNTSNQYNVNGDYTNNSGYYYATCNSVHTGLFQFAAFQFVPINFFNTPSAGTVPPIYPLGERAYTGKVGPTGLTGNYVAPSPGTPQPLPIGPTGDGNAVITFPFNTDPKASNGWPTPFISYNIPDSSLITDTIANWYQNPLNASVNCPIQTAPDNPYCTYQNYYQALLGKFYIKPTEAPSNLECGSEYAPPAQYWTDQGLTPPTGGCTGTSLCVPNYEYLKNIAAINQKPFTCQEPTSTDPYPMSYNGFNYTDPYNITPITWQNMFNYINGVPSGISSTPQNYKQIGLPPTLQDITNHDVNPVTNVTQKESETTLPFFLVLAIIGIIVFVCVIIYIIYKGNKSTEKDVYNPNTQANYRRVY